MAEFLRGTLVGLTRELMTLDYPHNQQVHGFLQGDLAHGGPRLTILDELLRVTEYLHLQVGGSYTFVVEPYWTTRPQYYPPQALPPAVGRYEEHIWWEEPIWWGGIVRDLQWHVPVEWSALANTLQPEHAWWLLETPAGEILFAPAPERAKWPRGELGALITWEQIRWFQVHAILP